jgi:predicted nucleic acid-binding protein
MDRARLTLVDSSAWIDYFRRTESAVDLKLDQLLRRGEELVTTEPVWMELLAGARDRADEMVIRRTLAACRTVRVLSPRDWEQAAAIYAASRRQGLTVRQHIDCLIAAVAIRAGLPILARDRDYELISQHTALQLAIA